MATPILPRAQAAPVGRDGNFTAEWRRFFESLLVFVGENTDTGEQIASILARLDALESEGDALATINGLNSVQVTGSLESGLVQIQLQSDTDAPGASFFYGTDSTGAKGWYERRLDTLADVDVSTAPVDGDALIFSGGVWAPGSSAPSVASLGCTFDGGGSDVTAGSQCDLIVPYDMTITSATMLGDAAGSIVIDVWSDTYGNYPPTAGDSITASAPPTLASAAKSQDSTLTGWSSTIAAGSTLRFNVNSCSGIARVTLTLEGTRT
jgi:hypothetical protein